MSKITDTIEDMVKIDGLESSKQNILVSGDNIKTINGISVLGAGNLVTGSVDIVSVSTNTDMVNSTHYIVTTSGLTLTLPSTPTIGDKIIISVEDFMNTTINRNTKNIGFLAENLAIDLANSTINLQYINLTEGWRLV